MTATEILAIKSIFLYRKATRTTLAGAFGLSLLAWIGATPAQGQGAPLTVNGVNYTISTQYNTFYALKTDLITTPWWGDSNKSNAFATAWRDCGEK